MGWWRVSADTLAESRFVLSALAETTASLIVLDRGTRRTRANANGSPAHRAAYP